jgi:hypothetical protein
MPTNLIPDEVAIAEDIGAFVADAAIITADETFTATFDGNDRLLTDAKSRWSKCGGSRCSRSKCEWGSGNG